MAQVLHMETNFPGKTNPMSSTVFRGKDQDLPYSVETPYGYRLDLDFLKYVDDIEKGNTIKRVPIHRRPRYNSLPRGYGYTGSWWTSTESLCSNVSMDSRHSSYSYCGRSFYPPYGLENRAPLVPGGFNARVEKTLLDAKRKLEEDNVDSEDGQRPRIVSLGSLQGSVSGSTSSLVGAGQNQSFSKTTQSGSQPGVSGQFTPMSSGLSTPVSPTPAHLQHVREQMAVALKRLRQLEEQVKMIPVLQVKISVLQEEKRQLSVQLKSQKFLGHTSGFGKSRPRGELYIDIPEEDGDQSDDVFSPPPLPCSPRQDSGCETEDSMVMRSVRQMSKKEMRSVSVGTDESVMERASKAQKTDVALKGLGEVRSVGILVKEQDLGLSSIATQAEVEQQRLTIESPCTKIAVLEKQLRKALHELHLAQQKLEEKKPKETSEKGQETKPLTADAISMTSMGWQELQAGRNKEVSEVGLQTFRQPQQVDQRTVGVQVCTLVQPTREIKKDLDETVTVEPVQVNRVWKEPEMCQSAPAVSDPACQKTKSSGSKDTSLSTEARLAKMPGEKEASPTQITFYETVVTNTSKTPYTVYRSSESLERTFPVQSNPSTNHLHLVKKISIKTETWGDEMKDTKSLSVQGSLEAPRVSSSEETHDALQTLERSEAAPDLCPANTGEKLIVTQAVAATQQEVPQVQAFSTGNLSSATSKQDPAAPTGDTVWPASPETTSLKSVIKQNEEMAEPPASKKNLHFVGVNGGYESTSSESSSEDSSDNESSESEYHEAVEAPMEGQGQKAESRPEQTEAEGVTTEGQRLAEEAVATRVDIAGSHRFALSDSLVSASVALQKYLGDQDTLDNKDMRAAYSTVLQEWLRVSCHKGADPEVVRQHMLVFRAMSPKLLEFIINMADGNGNTALHYTVSHSNFPVVKLLLDTGMCNVDRPNKAGYTAIMLTALAAFQSESDMEAVMQLLRLGNVNAKASQAGQTALMLAVSHGRLDMVKALLACGADINIQDDDGSTALMCACEHGHVEIVKVLLAEDRCNVALTDNDGSTALSIALEAGQKEIASLLHNHMNSSKSSNPDPPKPPQIGNASSPTTQ